MKFDEFNLNSELLESISYMGFKDATPIQEQAIPNIQNGQDVIACAQTGTGKTAAFLLPILNKLLSKPPKGTSTLIIVPTRELAIQIDQQIQGITYFSDLTSLAMYGGGDGDDWETQKKALKGGTNIIVGTPGKLISFLNLDLVNVKEIEYVILDEADRMLDIGFFDDIIKILSFLPKERQTLLFSATMPPKIRDLSNKILKPNPFEISIAIAKPAAGVLQGAYLAYESQKTDLVSSLIENKDAYKSIIIFSSTKKKVSEIVRNLKKKNFDVAGISSDLDQKDREEVLLQFRAKNTRIIVATDVLSRGIDIKDINLVINYDVPNDAQDYVHRVGRTARADTTGVALTFINEDDMYKFSQIETLIEKEVMKMPLPETLGKGPQWNPAFKKKPAFKKRR